MRVPKPLLKTAWALAVPLALLVPNPVRAGGYTLTTLHSFKDVDGKYPGSKLTLDAAGNILGATDGGGVYEGGTLFKIDAVTGAFSSLYSFNMGGDPAFPSSVTFDAAGNLYGTTNIGGDHGYGSVFRIDAATGALTTLHSFGGGADSGPAGVVLDAVGNLYGSTQFGGANHAGMVFKIDAATGAFSTLYSFEDDGSPIGLPTPSNLTLDAAGNLYGTTATGGGGHGSVFRIDAATGAFSELHSFDGSDGDSPMAGVVLDDAGNIYGATPYGGANDAGVIFRIDAATGAFSALHSFNDADGNGPLGVELDAAGNLYGATAGGGTYDYYGSVFKIDAQTGILATLHSFDGSGGYNPMVGVTLDAAGNIYGTTFFGGENRRGAVFRLSPNDAPAAVPEPSSLVMLGLGAGALALVARRKRS